MNLTRKGMISLALGILSPLAVMRGGSTLSALEQGHGSGLVAKITMPGGAVRTVKLEGIGCPTGMCSRTRIKGKAADDSLESVWLDAIASIRDSTETHTLLVMKDGTQRRISLVKDFRVLYVKEGSGATEKLDVATLKAVQFLSAWPIPNGSK